MRDQSSSALDLFFRRDYSVQALIGRSTKAGHLVRCRTKIDRGLAEGDKRQQAV